MTASLNMLKPARPLILICNTILGLQINGNTVKDDACSPTDDKIEQSNTSKYTIEQILDKASDFIDMYNYEMAQKFCQRALEIDNDNVRALETTATLLLEVSIIQCMLISNHKRYVLMRKIPLCCR